MNSWRKMASTNSSLPLSNSLTRELTIYSMTSSVASWNILSFLRSYSSLYLVNFSKVSLFL